MVRYIKNGASVKTVATEDAKTRALVEGMLGEIQRRGDAAVREYSTRLDQWGPESFRLNRAQIDACYEALPHQAMHRRSRPGRRSASSPEGW